MALPGFGWTAPLFLRAAAGDVMDPAWIIDARADIGRYHDGPDVPALAREVGEAFPDLAHYCAEAQETTAWCGIYVANKLAKQGIRPPSVENRIGFMWVDRWADWGVPVEVGREQPGDVAIFLRNPHHVTFVDHDGWYIGGNQYNPDSHASDSVTRAQYRTPDAIRRAPSASDIPSAFAASGRGSWYSQFEGKYRWVDSADDPDSNKLGVPDSAQGISFYDDSTLGCWFEVQAPNGVVSIEQQTDKGPSPHTGRKIDISAAAAERFGYTPKDFPTDAIFAWRRIDSPAAVSGLSPQAQAVRFRDLRKGKPMTDQATGDKVQVIQPQDDFFLRMVAYFVQHPDAIQRVTAFASYLRTGKDAAPPPSPPTPDASPVSASPAAPAALPKWGFGTGILGALFSGGLMQSGTIPPGMGEGSNLMSFLSIALPVALSAFGAGGGPAALLAKMAPSVFAALTKK